MKGMIFTEFLELVEGQFGFDALEAVIEKAQPASGGAYTAVGTYDHEELVGMVVALSEETGVPVPDLLKAFGHHVFARFVEGYPGFFEGVTDPLDFLASVEHYIHAEVRKLYPDAELPSFEHCRVDGGLELTYSSPRPLGFFAEGLIEGCIAHFGQDLSIDTHDETEGQGTRIRFHIH